MNSRERSGNTNGVLLVDKPVGWTSRKAVSTISRTLGCRKAGHAGTLDPLASGLLPVCLGRATLLSHYLTDVPKEYSLTARLGVTTDTYDMTGKVLARKKCDGMDKRMIEEALDRYRGSISQYPPPYSAVKYRGRPLYEYARSGRPFEVKPRLLTIYELRLIRFSKKDGRYSIDMKLSCSPGTYVRSLVHDLGVDLGCGAAVETLTRTRCGMFRLEDAISLAQEAPPSKQTLSRHMLTLEEATVELPTVVVITEGERGIAHGKPLVPEWLEQDRELPEASVFRVLSGSGRLIALYRKSEGNEFIGKAVRVIAPLQSPGGRQ